MTDADNASYLQQTGTMPAEVARTFFDACAKEDWSTVGKFWQGTLDDRSKTYLGGMEVVSLGKPFRARMSIAALLELQPNLRSQFKGMGKQKDFQGPQVFVPYEIRLKDASSPGSVRKPNSAPQLSRGVGAAPTVGDEASPPRAVLTASFRLRTDG